MITATDFVREVRKLAAARPDFVYEAVYDEENDATTCEYIHPGGRPGCIIGQAAQALGITAGQLADGDLFGVSAPTFLQFFEVPSDGTTSGWLKRVQELQDEGDKWAEAVRVADEAYVGQVS